MHQSITWIYDRLEIALHRPEVCKVENSRAYRLYVFFTEKRSDIEAYSYKGKKLQPNENNILYIGKVKYNREQKDGKKIPHMRIGERLLIQGHDKFFSIMEYETDQPIYLGIGKVENYTNDTETSGLENFLIHHLNPKYNTQKHSFENIQQITCSLAPSNERQDKFANFLKMTYPEN